MDLVVVLDIVPEDMKPSTDMLVSDMTFPTTSTSHVARYINWAPAVWTRPLPRCRPAW